MSTLRTAFLQWVAADLHHLLRGKMRTAADGIVTTRWSSKPADHKQTRVRNNQRRHRQRIKSHIADLETRLAESQRELHKAQSTIERLSAELKNTRTSQQLSCAGPAACGRPAAGTDDSSVRKQHSSPSSLRPRRVPPPQQQSCLDQPCVADCGRDVRTRTDGIAVFVSPATPFLGAAPTAAIWTTYDVAVAGEEKKYCDLQPPDPAESTTLCRDAYKIIAEQNFAGLEASDLHRWLAPAFRGPCTKGDGCRVENGLLFALLDYLST